MMKKALLCILAVLMLGSLPVLADNGGIEDDWGDVEFEEKVLRGDANADGKLNTADYVVVKRHVLRTLTLSDKGFLGADVNGDGKISAVDYVLIKRVVMGTAEFPCLHDYAEEVIGNLHVFTCKECGYQYKKFDGELIG
jgi:hypothetical protein